MRARCVGRHGHLGREHDGDRPGEWLAHALAVVRGVDAGAIAKSVAPDKIEGAIRQARLKALRAWRDRERGGLLL